MYAISQQHLSIFYISVHQFDYVCSSTSFYSFIQYSTHLSDKFCEWQHLMGKIG